MLKMNADAVSFAFRQQNARLRELCASGVEYGEAMRQVYHPGISKEEYAAWYAKYQVAYDAQFGVKLGSR